MKRVTRDGAHPAAESFFEAEGRWREELTLLRTIALDCGLTEELKWGKPCYTVEGSNVVILQGFNESCALLFTHGALLRDPQALLEKPGENTQAARRIPFTSVREIAGRERVIKAYIKEAVAVARAGLKVNYKPVSAFAVPDEFQHRLESDAVLKQAFAALTPGRQRGYLLHFAGAKQSATRAARIDKCRRRILQGKGLHDD